MNKTVVITGGTSGYGLAIAKKFKGIGYTVLITGRNDERLFKAQKESGADFIFKQDVKSYNGWLALKKYAIEKMHKVDVLVNNAGGGVSIKPIEEQNEQTINDILALNLSSVMYAANVFVPDMKARQKGTIVNISSVSAISSTDNESCVSFKFAASWKPVLADAGITQLALTPNGCNSTCNPLVKFNTPAFAAA